MPNRYRGSPSEILALDSFVKLTRAANTLTGRLYGHLQRECGMTESQLGVLEALYHLGPMAQTQLCAKILRSGSNLTTVVDNLERNGWVRRERGAEDRRVQMVHITEEGRRAIEGALPGHVARIAGLLGALTDEEQRQLGRLCRKLGLANAG